MAPPHIHRTSVEKKLGHAYRSYARGKGQHRRLTVRWCQLVAIVCFTRTTCTNNASCLTLVRAVGRTVPLNTLKITTEQSKLRMVGKRWRVQVGEGCRRRRMAARWWFLSKTSLDAVVSCLICALPLHSLKTNDSRPQFRENLKYLEVADRACSLVPSLITALRARICCAHRRYTQLDEKV